MKVVQLLRSLVFYALFLSWTVLCALIVGTIAITTRRRTETGLAIGRAWGNVNLWLLRWVVGITTRFEGAENISTGPCIVASKHMSDWDIFAILPHTVRPAFIAKAELIAIPFFGWAATSIDTIRIDRKLGAEAIPAMLADARAALSRGCQIIIFPEGTRKQPLADPDYRQGIMRMYEALNVPVVPVALNSGVYWSRRSLILWPGTAVARALPPIEPGLDAQTFRRRLVSEIEQETIALIQEAVDSGLGRPVPDDWREKLDKTTTY
jgi:1-acyl-sn-glycerol-3-phosphate acyltransferase